MHKYLIHGSKHQSETNFPQIRQPAPDFSGTAVINLSFETITLSQYKGKYVVLFFYPLDFTFVCPTEITAFSERINEFKAINCEIIGASCDSQFSHLAWIQQPRKQGGIEGITFPLLADKSGKIAHSYGVLNIETGVPFRGLYIIDAKGILRLTMINDTQIGRSVDEVLRLVKAFQFTDANGEVCPMGWQPGSKTIKANPEGAQEYFKTVQ